MLFEREKAVARFVELGPSNVLVNMAKKTRDAKYLKRDILLCLNRQFLASTQDAKEIQYQYAEEDLPVPEESEEPENLPSSAAHNPVAETMEREPLNLVPEANAVAATSIADVPMTSLEVLKALVAYKLRKPVGQVPSTRSIKDLSAGEKQTSLCRNYISYANRCREINASERDHWRHLQRIRFESRRSREHVPRCPFRVI